ncbi:MAG: ankyrin repeat domain-containing protein [Pyrinomonadaceae bacterium]
MSKKSLIDRIRVNEPCTQDWETMRGSKTVRFCDHCSKNVNNLSEMSRKDAVRMIRATGADICVRYIKNPTNELPMFADQLIQISRRAPRLAAGVMSASMSLATMAYSQGSARSAEHKTASIERVQTSVDENKMNKPADDLKAQRTLSGTVVDQNGAAIPGAKVILGGAVDSRTVMANDEGKYKFDEVPAGNYILQTESPGFRTHSTRILITNDEAAKHDVGMDVGTIEVSVDVPLETEMEVSISGGAMVIEYTTELNKAVASDDIERVTELISQGANVNGKDEGYDKITPLFIAVENGNVEIAKLLLQFGAKVNIRDSERQTPLMRLDDDSNAEMVELLLQHGAKIDLEDKQGNTALIIAAEYANADVVAALLQGDPDVKVANKEGQTALMNAAYDDDIEKVRLLLNAGSEVNAKNNDGETAWDQASNEEVETLLVTFGAAVKIKEKTADDDREEPPVEKGTIQN